MKIGLAFRAFFAALFDSDKAKSLAAAMEGKSAAALTEPAPKKSVAPSTTPQSPVLESKRSDALTLLATLQREARLIDLVQEPLSNYSDAQVGAAARGVLADTQKVLQRMFDIKPLSSASEGDTVSIDDQTPSGHYKYVGKSAAAKSGAIVHPGWIATTLNIPTWTGADNSKQVLMPAEYE